MSQDKGKSGTGNNFYTDVNIIELNCRSEELFDAMDLFNEKRTILPIFRSYLHEHTHFIQHNTTPVGYYLKLLRDYQKIYMPKITDEMLKAPEFTYPMMWHIQKRKNEKDRFKRPIHFYYYWYLAEVVRQYLNGDYETFEYYIHQMAHDEFYGIYDFMLELEPELIKMLHPGYGYRGRKIIITGSEEKSGGNYFDPGFGMPKLNALNDVLESQALLAEYYFDETADERLLKALSKEKIPSWQSDYLYPLITYARKHSFDLSKKEDFLSFKLGFHAICQIVLHAPILPFQDRLGEVLFADIEIELRLAQLLSISNVSPPKSFDDYDRYIAELIDAAGYKSLESVTQNILVNGDLIMNSRMNSNLMLKKEKLFLSAQKLFRDDKMNFYHLLSGLRTQPGDFGFKFLDKAARIDEAEIVDILNNLIYQYYKELLMGYEMNKSHDVIYVSPVVQVRDQIMELLQESIDTFNEIQSDRLPKMVLTEH